MLQACVHVAVAVQNQHVLKAQLAHLAAQIVKLIFQRIAELVHQRLRAENHEYGFAVDGHVVGIGEVVFGNFLVIFSTRNLFLKNHIVYFFGSKLTSFFLFSFLIHPVEPPFLSFTSIRFIQSIVGIVSTVGVATYCDVLQNTALPILWKTKIFHLPTKGQNKLCKQCTCVHTSCVLQISAKLIFAKACWEASQTL